MTDVLAPKNVKKRRLFYCEICHFECSKQSDYNRHILTAKHKNTYNLVKKLTQDLQKNADPESTGYTCECGKVYKHRQSLHSHRKKCPKVASDLECVPEKEDKVKIVQSWNNIQNDSLPITDKQEVSSINEVD